MKPKTVTALYAEFEAAIAAMNALPPAPATASTIRPQSRSAARDRALDRCNEIAWRIVKARASSVWEMLLKIRIVGWCDGARHHELAELDCWEPGGVLAKDEAHFALATLRDDLRRLEASHRLDVVEAERRRA